MKHGRRAGKILSSVSAWLLVLLGAVFVYASAAEAVIENSARVVPSYPREDLTEVLAKPYWDEEDLSFLYRQTGLGPAALESLKDQRQRIPAFQDALFYQGELVHDFAAFTTPHECLKGYFAPLAPLENGDVIVTSSCHTLGWRNGHAGLVTNAKTLSVLQSVAPGTLSHIETADWFMNSSNFIVLRLKDASGEERDAIAQKALTHLKNIPYSLLVGILSPKDAGETVEKTHCSHLVWQAFRYFGYDIDSNGGAICTARDISRSDLFEVVQVFGFDVDKLW